MDDFGLGELGYIMLSINSLFQGIFAFIGPPMNHKYGMRKMITLGSFGLGMMTYVMIYPAWIRKITEKDSPERDATHVPISIVCMTGFIIGGIGQAFLYVVQGEYLSKCATEKTKGFYFGYNWVFYMGS